MPVQCEDCGVTTSRYVTKFHSGGSRTTCHTCEHPVKATCHNPFSDLTLEHVHDEQGRPLRVTSSRQLREAEKKYHFRSVVAHTDEANFDKPPQQQKGDLYDFMSREKKWLYPEIAESMIKDMREGRLA